MQHDLPLYQCHKTVRAARIREITAAAMAQNRTTLTPAPLRYFLHLEGVPEATEVSLAWFGKHSPQAGGYFVQYADGYASYSPAKAFEEGYTRTPPPAIDPVEQRIQTLGLNAPRITPEDLEANIASEHYFTGADGACGALPKGASDEQINGIPSALGLLTICVLVLRNGFTVVGTSACASPENFDAGTGRMAARRDAARQVWALMGYELRSQLARTAAAADRA
jgi:hypothetical protein